MILAAAWWILRLSLRPIAEVTCVAKAISSGDRSRRVPVPADGTEAANLARSFNSMIDQQQSSEDRLRHFLADASHELRTPVRPSPVSPISIATAPCPIWDWKM